MLVTSNSKFYWHKCYNQKKKKDRLKTAKQTWDNPASCTSLLTTYLLYILNQQWPQELKMTHHILEEYRHWWQALRLHVIPRDGSPLMTLSSLVQNMYSTKTTKHADPAVLMELLTWNLLDKRSLLHDNLEDVGRYQWWRTLLLTS